MSKVIKWKKQMDWHVLFINEEEKCRFHWNMIFKKFQVKFPHRKKHITLLPMKVEYCKNHLEIICKS